MKKKSKVGKCERVRRDDREVKRWREGKSDNEKEIEEERERERYTWRERH